MDGSDQIRDVNVGFSEMIELKTSFAGNVLYRLIMEDTGVLPVAGGFAQYRSK